MTQTCLTDTFRPKHCKHIQCSPTAQRGRNDRANFGTGSSSAVALAPLRGASAAGIVADGHGRGAPEESMATAMPNRCHVRPSKPPQALLEQPLKRRATLHDQWPQIAYQSRLRRSQAATGDAGAPCLEAVLRRDVNSHTVWGARAPWSRRRAAGAVLACLDPHGGDCNTVVSAALKRTRPETQGALLTCPA